MVIEKNTSAAVPFDHFEGVEAGAQQRERG
jgi:hypothetical protein